MTTYNQNISKMPFLPYLAYAVVNGVSSFAKSKLPDSFKSVVLTILWKSTHGLESADQILEKIAEKKNW